MAHIATAWPKSVTGYPELVIDMSLRSNNGKNDAALAALADRIERHGMKINQVSADMGYHPSQLYKYLTKRGIVLVSDLPENEIGVWEPGPIPGTIWLEGNLYRKEILLREDLVHIPKATKTNRVEPRKHRDERRAYAYRPDNGLDTETGKVVFASPVANGRMVCHNHPQLAKNPEFKPLTTCPDLEDPDGKCDCLKSATVYPKTVKSRKGEGLPHNYQRLNFGTTNWDSEYFGVREHAESTISLTKTHYSNWRGKGFSKVLGLTKNMILYFLSAIANNVRMERTWSRKRGMDDPWTLLLGETDDLPVPTLPPPAPAQRRKRRERLDDVGPPGNPPDGDDIDALH